MACLFKNNAASTLSRPINSTFDWLKISDNHKTTFPEIVAGSGDYFYLTLVGDDALEIVKVTGYSFDDFNETIYLIDRAQEGTTARAWPAGTRVELRITAGALGSLVPTAVQIAQDNVDAIGVASTTNVGFAGVDGQTTRADAGGAITVKDVAIGGNLGDLASARGQIGDAKEMPNLDFNTLTTPGNYRITGNPTNGPSLPLNISGASIGSLIVAGTPGQTGRIFQIMISGSAVTWRTIQNSTGTEWSAWQQLLSGNKVGDGIRVTNGIISVPEMQGATASTDGTSGLVPPAAAGQQESFLTGGGEYVNVLPIAANAAMPNSDSYIDYAFPANETQTQIIAPYDGYVSLTFAYIGKGYGWIGTTSIGRNGLMVGGNSYSVENTAAWFCAHILPVKKGQTVYIYASYPFGIYDQWAFLRFYKSEGAA